MMSLRLRLSLRFIVHVPSPIAQHGFPERTSESANLFSTLAQPSTMKKILEQRQGRSLRVSFKRELIQEKKKFARLELAMNKTQLLCVCVGGWVQREKKDLLSNQIPCQQEKMKYPVGAGIHSRPSRSRTRRLRCTPFSEGSSRPVHSYHGECLGHSMGLQHKWEETDSDVDLRQKTRMQ